MPELHYSTAGSGEPLLILHGLFGSSKNWHSHMRRFAEDFEVFSIDLRNHGQSFHAEQMDYSLMAADVAQLVTHLQLENCRVIGHSMGGKVAMALAILNPGLLSRMIVADIAPVAYQHSHDPLIDPILALDLRNVESRAQVDQGLQAAITDASLRAFLMQNLVREAGEWRWRVNWSVIQREMSSLTGFVPLSDDWSCDLPSLFLRGANSDYVGEVEAAVIKKRFPASRLETIADAGHWLHAEQPLQFARLAKDFLRQ
jgi:esterase